MCTTNSLKEQTLVPVGVVSNGKSVLAIGPIITSFGGYRGGSLTAVQA